MATRNTTVKKDKMFIQFGSGVVFSEPVKGKKPRKQKSKSKAYVLRTPFVDILSAEPFKVKSTENGKKLSIEKDSGLA